MSAVDSRPVSELFADALNQFSALIRNELQLARAEISLSASKAMSAVALLIASGLFLIPGIVLLLIALASWIEELGATPPVAHLVAGVVGLVIAGILAGIGMSRLRANSFVPTRTLDQIERDVAAAKEHV